MFIEALYMFHDHVPPFLACEPPRGPDYVSVLLPAEALGLSLREGPLRHWHVPFGPILSETMA